MKKLKFNTGGQPVWLDDIETMQNNMFSLNVGKAFLTDGQSGYAMGRVIEVNEFGFTDKTYKVGAHRIVIGDNVYDIEGMTNSVGDVNKLYYHVREAEEDARTMRDGSEKACGVNLTGFMDSNATAAGTVSYKFGQIENLPNAVRKAVGLNDWQNVEVTPLNGFDVSVRTKIVDNDVARTMIIARGSFSQSWLTSEKKLFSWDSTKASQTKLKNVVTESQGVHRKVLDGQLVDCGRLAFDSEGCRIIMDSSDISPDSPQYYEVRIVIER